MRWAVFLFLLLLLLLAGPWQSPTLTGSDGDLDLAGTIDFSRDIRPILSRHCFPCHGPDAETRRGDLRLDTESGIRSVHDAAIDINGSELQHRLETDDPDESMPPPDEADPLKKTELTSLLAWVSRGAPYEEHWAFETPVVTDDKQLSIDTFIDDRLRAEGIVANGPATAETLIRRLHLDLTGLPPSLDDVEEFAARYSRNPHTSWQQLIDEVLASPAYGEHWASLWLDLARYADTKGYESDGHRNIWPWRDWLIDALDADIPFDRFTLEMIAGDLLEDADENSRLATAFHRNTMTNDEGGTQDEEFRVAAVVDRVNTTMQVWMGLTMGCAQCHDHKYDPFSQKDYYRLFDVFNQSADADRNDEMPLQKVAPISLREQISVAKKAIEREREALAETLAGLHHDDPGPLFDGGWRRQPQETVWLEDGWTPPLANLRAEEKPQPWPWRDPQVKPPVGNKVVAIAAPKGQFRQVYFDDSLLRFGAESGDQLIVWLRVHPEDPPEALMVQVHCLEGKWEHRAFWGEDRFTFGVKDTSSRRHLGEVPKPGEWTRLEIPFEEIGIEPDQTVTGVALSQHGGNVEWAAVHHRSLRIQDRRFLHSLEELRNRQRRQPSPLISSTIDALLKTRPGTLSDADARTLETWYLANVEDEARRLLGRQGSTLGAGEIALGKLEAQRVSVPVMRDLPAGKGRQTHLLRRGYYLNPGEPLEAAPPDRFHRSPEDAPFDRLALARWLLSDENPLTARVHVNRVWEQIFGTGIVDTPEDFGTRGSLPSHQRLLDWLAHTFRHDDRWSQKALLRRIVSSETYRRSSLETPQLQRLDPQNRWLARASRIRLRAEVVRDQALALGGILSPKKHGPPVYPPQPKGVWQIVYSGAQWKESSGEDRVRRSVYTYWRRTSPYPSLMLFDAPDRGVCRPRRIRTNTPLQALVTLNDPVFIEAATGLARQLVAGLPQLQEVLADAFSRVTLRPALPTELEMLESLYHQQRKAYLAAPQEARKLLDIGGWNPDDGIDPIELATLVVISNVLLNLDEVLVRG